MLPLIVGICLKKFHLPLSAVRSLEFHGLLLGGISQPVSFTDSIPKLFLNHFLLFRYKKS